MSINSFNKANIESLRFLLVRRDEIGTEFRRLFRDSISGRYVDDLFDNPYEFTAYHVLKKLKLDCEMFFGCKDWFLYLKEYKCEAKLLKAIRLEERLDIDEDIPDKTSALSQLSARLYRFRILVGTYERCDDNTADEIIKGNSF